MLAVEKYAFNRVASGISDALALWGDCTGSPARGPLGWRSPDPSGNTNIQRTIAEATPVFGEIDLRTATLTTARGGLSRVPDAGLLLCGGRELRTSPCPAPRPNRDQRN